MTLEEGVWTLFREGPDWPQRYVGELSEDGNTIAGRWERGTELGAPRSKPCATLLSPRGRTDLALFQALSFAGRYSMQHAILQRSIVGRGASVLLIQEKPRLCRRAKERDTQASEGSHPALFARDPARRRASDQGPSLSAAGLRPSPSHSTRA
jgi:hypothetical protein